VSLYNSGPSVKGISFWAIAASLFKLSSPRIKVSGLRVLIWHIIKHITGTLTRLLLCERLRGSSLRGVW
jgi:hypothetical protein